MKPKVLGTGLSGLVGSRIVELLSSDFDFEDLRLEDGFDITKPGTLEAKIAPSPAQTLIHLAAFTDVGAAWKEKDNQSGLCYQVNVTGTKNIAHLCAKHGKCLIHFSTDFVFDGGKDEPYVETDLPNPIDWYGRTKYLAEEEVKTSRAKFCIIRIAFPFRSNYNLKKDFIHKMIDAFKAGSLYPQFTDQVITPSFVDDIAAGIKKILSVKPEGIFHLTGSSFISPYELSQKVSRVFGLDQSLIKEGSLVEYRKTNPTARPYNRCLKMSNEKAKRELGIEMQTIDEALLELKAQI